jgi:cytochrome b6-f complex iron-sulfur subunit
LSNSAVICARRQLLLGAGVGGVALVAACSSSSSSGNAGTSTSTSGGGGSSAGLLALAKVPSDSAVSVQDSSGRSLLLTQSGGKLTALDATCTHQGCTVSPAGPELVCPCHGSQFTLTGAVTSGPAPTALHVVAVKVVSGQVELA